MSFSPLLHVDLRACVLARKHMDCVDLRLFVCVDLCLFLRSSVYENEYIYIYIYIYMHVYCRTNIYIYIYACLL